MKHLNIKIRGRVQGVFFRKSTQDKARELGLKGFVRNEPHGSVYLEAEGPENGLMELVEWCHTGSPGAEVEDVHVAEGSMKGFDSFQVAY